jgi:hypothetical protein
MGWYTSYTLVFNHPLTRDEKNEVSKWLVEFLFSEQDDRELSVEDAASYITFETIGGKTMFSVDEIKNGDQASDMKTQLYALLLNPNLPDLEGQFISVRDANRVDRIAFNGTNLTYTQVLEIGGHEYLVEHHETLKGANP